jgi:hypothetical protein
MMSLHIGRQTGVLKVRQWQRRRRWVKGQGVVAAGRRQNGQASVELSSGDTEIKVIDLLILNI